MSKYELIEWNPTTGALSGASAVFVDIGLAFGPNKLKTVFDLAVKIAIMSAMKRVRLFLKEGFANNSLGLTPRRIYESAWRKDPRSILRGAGSVDIGAMIASNRPVRLNAVKVKEIKRTGIDGGVLDFFLGKKVKTSNALMKSARARGNQVMRHQLKVSGQRRPLFGKLGSGVTVKTITEPAIGGKVGFLAERMGGKWQDRVENLVLGNGTDTPYVDAQSERRYWGALGMPKDPTRENMNPPRDFMAVATERIPVAQHMEDRMVSALYELLAKSQQVD
jgi:hypothetical protein